MTFLSLGCLIYINLWHSSTHIRDQHHAESATDHHGGITARKVKCCGDNNSPRKTLPHHIEELARIYIYICYIIYIYIYIRMYIAYIMYMIYIVATLSQKRHLSVSSQNPQWRRTVRRRWGLGQNDHRDVDHLGLFESQNGARLSIVMWNLWRICILYKYIRPIWYVIYIYMYIIMYIQKWRSKMVKTQHQVQNLNQRFPNWRIKPKSEEKKFSKTFIFSGIENFGNQENLICLCSSRFFKKGHLLLAVRHWVALNIWYYIIYWYIDV